MDALIQGNTIPMSNNGNGTINATFRCERYLPTFGAFTGRNLTPGNYLEINPLPSSCSMSTNIIESAFQNQNRQLLYITDMLGKRTGFQYNTLLLYQYDDSSVEKIFIIK